MLVALIVVTVLGTSNYVGGNFDEDNDNSNNNQVNGDNIQIMIITVMLTKSF